MQVSGQNTDGDEQVRILVEISGGGALRIQNSVNESFTWSDSER